MHHEYGHYVTDSFNFQNNPGGPHNIGDCIAVVQSSKSKGLRLAWDEGWATYFGTGGQMELGLGATQAPRVGDTVYTDTINGFGGFSYGLETNSGPGADSLGIGEDNEIAVQRLLWDMYDTNSDSRDTLSYSDLQLFNVFRGSGVTTLSGGWALVRASGLVPDNQTDLAAGAITTDHVVGPQPLSPAAGTTVGASNANFSWAADVGCDSSFAGDDFDLVFYNANTFAEILRKSGLTSTSARSV